MIAKSFCPLVLVLSCACSGPSAPAPQPSAGLTSAPAPQPREGLYAKASTSEQLIGLLDGDLARRDFRSAQRGLRFFVDTCQLERRCTAGSALLDEVDPVTRFRMRGGDEHLTAIKTLVGILALEAQREVADLGTVIGALDLPRLRDLRTRPGALLHPDVVARSGELEPFALLVDGLLLLEEQGRGSVPGSELVERVVGDLDHAADVFDRRGLDDHAFLAQVAAAQLLEGDGREEPALERWIRIERAPWFAAASPAVRIAVQGRVESFRSRLRGEMESTIRAEEEARARELVAALRAEHARNELELSQALAGLESELANADKAHAADLRASRVELEQWYEQRLERLSARIRELEQLLTQVVRSGEDPAVTEAPELLRTGLSMAADVLTLVAMTRGRAPRR